ncbi:putative reverse transcriptase [Burkholderia lata]|uniref:retron Ec67 family RNA-directed DNA polymerase/endonuclease n=1 Tax=Burkholderia lata (strain ATCC 17760 / DSM 23089 / LMG 22485 / NCIMB 9086 / R18194 / 383) TaxID=482957 RepID=UPI00145494B1|nr:retron Ec67 family RNA-directed DNA polymerase/endonuclease [Burkholderia lata]VWD33728.1 putative reverse transcriptase [Burkholderia lata]
MKKPTQIAQLRSQASLHGLAALLGYEPKGLAYVVYGIKDADKYADFSIAKRSGGTRIISAPVKSLKLLQSRVSTLLAACAEDIEVERGEKNKLYHGFRKNHSILTNATVHRGKRYVFNVDLNDFFGSIHFGRVTGFFTKNRYFELEPVIARMLAQIACHNAVLPQGSPCSPVISNLIAHILDVRMAQLAARHDCYYSRYADDLTFSTNREGFPKAIAMRVGDSNEWAAGKSLLKIIKDSRFEINHRKTRMQFYKFRQDVTGIVVNKKLNVPREYIRDVRAMVNSFVKTEEFTLSKKYRDDDGAWIFETVVGEKEQLRGMLSFIDNVRVFPQKKLATEKKDKREQRIARVELKDMDGVSRTYRRFLQYTQFYNPELPFIICEGKTDNVYIKCALRQLAEKYPKLVSKTASENKLLLNFFNYTKVADRILHLGGGTGDFQAFIGNYGGEFKGFKSKKKRNPVILLIDNDDGTAKIFSSIKSVTKRKSTVDGSEPFYHITDNFYVVAVPRQGGKPTTIEDFFEPALLKTKLGTKVFSGKDGFDPTTEYGKHYFAEYIVKKRQKTINFSGFHPILERLVAVLDDYAARP